ncbi:MAG: RNA polymerase sigma factor [Solirubrobacterales bacterium]
MTPPPAEQFAARIFMGPALRAQPDRRLVDLVRDGYDAAFEEIVRRYRRPLDRFAAAIVGGRSEDVTQDAFSKALLALRGSEAEIELRPWLYRIVRNTALNDLRDRAPQTDELPETLPGGQSAAAAVLAREELADLMKRLRALPENYRAALVMRELEGLSHEEIAAALGLSGGAARQVLHRARTTLREGLGLVVPLPLVRALAEHADDAGRAGGAIAAGAGSSAGGAALGGLGGGALKAGMATVLIAGAVGAGVAVEHHKHTSTGPEAAEAAPLPHGKHRGSGASASVSGTQTGPPGGAEKHGRGGENRSPGDHTSRGGDGRPGSLGGESGSGRSGSGSKHSDGGSGGSGSQSPSADSGGSDDKSGSSGRDGGGGSGGSGSDDGSGGSGSSSGGGSSGSDGGQSSGSDGSGSGGGGGGVITEPITTPEPIESSDGGSGSGSTTESSGESSGGSGSGDLSGSDSSGSDGSP